MEEKCVMVIDNELPVGFLANTAAILGITLGKQRPDLVGIDVQDKDGNNHLGIISIPVPILKGDVSTIRQLREKLFTEEFEDCTVVDFSGFAEGINVYDDFIREFAKVEEKDLKYFGIGLIGPKKKINKLTGSMPLLR